jgi:3-oxoacyl-[acyl-carrier protein] reductase
LGDDVPDFPPYAWIEDDRIVDDPTAEKPDGSPPRGLNTVVTGRSADAGKTVAATIREAGHEATYVRADTADPDDVERPVDAVIETYGAVDVVINDAAAWRHGTVSDRSLSDWEYVMDVSLRAPWFLSELAAERMPVGGSVITVSSVHAVRTDPGRFP